MRILKLAVILITLLIGSAGWAVQPDEVLEDPALESRARALSKELRCMVCQNQSIDDSDAPLARDLRILVRDRLKAGDSDSQVIDFLTERYGDFVLLKPPFNWQTALLWFGPATFLAGGMLGIFFAARRRSRTAAPGPSIDNSDGLSADEKARLAKLLNQGSDTP